MKYEKTLKEILHNQNEEFLQGLSKKLTLFCKKNRVNETKSKLDQ